MSDLNSLFSYALERGLRVTMDEESWNGWCMASIQPLESHLRGTAAIDSKPDRAWMKALMEWIERDCARALGKPAAPTKLHKASLLEMQARGFNVPSADALRYYHSEQFSKPGFQLRPWSEDQPVYWIQGRRVEEEFWLPVELVGLSKENLYWHITSSGLAAHHSKAEAEIAAELELIERHEVLRCWWSRTQDFWELSPEILPPQGQKLLEQILSLRGGQVSLRGMVSSVAPSMASARHVSEGFATKETVNVVLALWSNAEIFDGPTFLCASAASLGFAAAALKSLQELALCLSFARASDTPLKYSDDIHHHGMNQRYYLSEENLQKNFFYQGLAPEKGKSRRTVSRTMLSGGPDPESGHGQGDSSTASAFFDLTGPIESALGVSVVRAWRENLIPLNSSHLHRPLALLERFLHKNGVSRVNSQPHPFP